MELKSADKSSVSKQVTEYMKLNNMKIKGFIEKYGFRRTTFYERRKFHNWSQHEIVFLKSNGVIK